MTSHLLFSKSKVQSISLATGKNIDLNKGTPFKYKDVQILVRRWAAVILRLQHPH